MRTKNRSHVTFAGSLASPGRPHAMPTGTSQRLRTAASTLAVLGLALGLGGCPEDETIVGDVTDTTDTLRQDVVPTPGELGDPCREDNDCESNLCAPVAASGRVCTQTCTVECPAGYQCVTSDGASVCADMKVANCQPCDQDADCNRAGLTGNTCRAYGDTGSFCASSCVGDSDCPSGYSCDGGSCRFEGETCACNAIGIALGAETTCSVTNEHGTCEGARGCASGGLSRCMAETPAAESCDGRDNDCDGETDETLPETACDLTNEYGTCVGSIVCTEGRPLCTGRAPAAEVCNGIDDNCDGETDEGAADFDEDGIVDCLDDDWDGDESLNVDDCAPFNPAIHPGATEVCNGVDDNCNRQVDENTQAECGCYTCGGTSGCLVACDSDEQVAEGFVCDLNDFDNDNNRRECQPSVCGNGILEANEVCDDVQNDGRYGGCLRCEELGPRCGDGVIQPAFELCDDGLLNGTPNSCNQTCNGQTPPFCGNGVIEEGEICDLGEGNLNTRDAGCRPDCTPRRCGDGVADSNEACDAGAANGTSTCGCNSACGFPAAQVTCRASGGVCDAAETCNGAGACAADVKRVGFICREAAGACDQPDTCQANSNDCPADAKLAAGSVCRIASGVCDVSETCDGQANTCPQDAFATAETQCRPAATICDAAEMCTGLSRTCPNDRPARLGVSCRDGTGTCDPGESCNGISFECPANTYAERGVGCNEDPTCEFSPCACDGVGMCLSACGNGDLDEGEECDDGELNGQRDRCSLTCQAVCGGMPTWVTSVGGYGHDGVNDLTTTLDGAGFAVGTYSPEGEWGGWEGAEFGDFNLGYFGWNDGFVLGHDTEGEVTWASCLGGYWDDQAASVATGGDGVYVVGSYQGQATFACCDVQIPTAPQRVGVIGGENECVTVGDQFSEDSSDNMYIARWSTDGEFEWVIDGGKHWSAERANSVASDPLGWAFVAGQIYNDGENNNSTSFGNLELTGFGGTDAFVASFNRFGSGDMAVVIGGPGYERAIAVTLDGGDGVYVLIETDGDFEYQGNLIEVFGYNDLVLIALGRDGSYRWHTNFNDALELGGDSFNNGNIAYGCRLAASGDGQCGIHAFVSTYNNAHVARFTLDGDLDWVSDVNADGEMWAGDLAVERNGRVSVTGSFTGFAEFGDDELEAERGGGGTEFFEANAPSFEGYGDIFVARLDTQGEWLWAKSAGASGRDYGTSIGLDDAGSVYVGGAFERTVDFGQIELTARGSDEAWWLGPDGFFGKLIVPPEICYECGDGQMDPGESCDEEETNSCSGSCNGTCDGPNNNCGDGLAQCGEDYDMGEADEAMCTYVAGNAWCFEVAAVNAETNNNFTLDPVRPGEPARYGGGVLRENWNQPNIETPGPFDGLQGNPNQLSVCPTLQVGEIINHKALSAKQWGGDIVTETGTSEGNRLFCDGDIESPPSATAPASFADGRNTLDAAMECGDYFEFVSSTGFEVAFEFDNRAAVQGPTNYALYVSISGNDDTWEYVGRGTTFQAGDFGSTFTPPMTSFDLTDFVTGEGPVAFQPEVHFRLYGWGASSVGDPWTLDNVRVGEPLRDEPFRTVFCFEETEDANFTTTPSIERAAFPASFATGPGLATFTNINGPAEVLNGCPQTSNTHKAPSTNNWPLGADYTGEDYYEFNFEAPEGTYAFSYDARRSNSGPSKFALVSDQYGLLATNRDMAAGGSWARFSFPIYHDGGTLTLRIHGYAATANDGTMQVDNVELVGTSLCYVEYAEECIDGDIGLSDTAGAFTVDIDLAPTTQAGSVAVLSQRAACIANEAGGANGWWSVRMNNGKISFESWTPDAGYQATTGVTPVNDGVWHRLRMVRDAAGMLSIFVDDSCTPDVTESHPGTFGSMDQPIGLEPCIGVDGTVANTSQFTWSCVTAP